VQGFGVQVVPKPSQVPEQAACGTKVHVPSVAQQAPEGCRHGFGEQTEPKPSHW